MAFESNLVCESFIAEEDLSAKQFHFVKQGAAAGGILLNDTVGGDCIGILQNKPTSGQAAQVAVGGVSKCVFGAAIAAGVKVKSSATGKAASASLAVVNTSDGGSATDRKSVV